MPVLELPTGIEFRRALPAHQHQNARLDISITLASPQIYPSIHLNGAETWKALVSIMSELFLVQDTTLVRFVSSFDEDNQEVACAFELETDHSSGFRQSRIYRPHSDQMCPPLDLSTDYVWVQAVTYLIQRECDVLYYHVRHHLEDYLGGSEMRREEANLGVKWNEASDAAAQDLTTSFDIISVTSTIGSVVALMEAWKTVVASRADDSRGRG